MVLCRNFQISEGNKRYGARFSRAILCLLWLACMVPTCVQGGDESPKPLSKDGGSIAPVKQNTPSKASGGGVGWVETALSKVDSFSDWETKVRQALELENRDERKKSLISIFENWVKKNSKKDWKSEVTRALKLKGEDERKKSLTSIFEDWAGRSPKAAAREAFELSQGTEKMDFSDVVMRIWMGKDPDSAKSWAVELGRRKQRAEKDKVYTQMIKDAMKKILIKNGKWQDPDVRVAFDQLVVDKQRLATRKISIPPDFFNEIKGTENPGNDLVRRANYLRDKLELAGIVILPRTNCVFLPKENCLQVTHDPQVIDVIEKIFSKK